jgi:hypothetical protein
MQRDVTLVRWVAMDLHEDARELHGGVCQAADRGVRRPSRPIGDTEGESVTLFAVFRKRLNRVPAKRICLFGWGGMRFSF